MELDCPVCECSFESSPLMLRDYELYTEDLYSLQECPNCGLLFLDPKLSFKKLAEHYPPGFNSCTAAFFGAKFLWKIVRELERRKFLLQLPPLHLTYNFPEKRNAATTTTYYFDDKYLK